MHQWQSLHAGTRSLRSWVSRVQAMARPAYSSVVSHATDGRPAIVFVPTRKHARLTAMDFLAFAAADGEPSRFLRVRAFALLGGNPGPTYRRPVTIQPAWSVSYCCVAWMLRIVWLCFL